VKEPAVSQRDRGRPDGAATFEKFGHNTSCGVSADGKRQLRSVWSIATRPFKGAHFATFPPDLVRPCILAGCPEGGTVLDPFFGAGTTGLVAQQLDRNAIGIELNPVYAAIASERLGINSPLPLRAFRAALAADDQSAVARLQARLQGVA
jgi:DNA modification methylase